MIAVPCLSSLTKEVRRLTFASQNARLPAISNRIASQKSSKICRRIPLFSASLCTIAARSQARLSPSCHECRANDTLKDKRKIFVRQAEVHLSHAVWVAERKHTWKKGGRRTPDAPCSNRSPPSIRRLQLTGEEPRGRKPREATRVAARDRAILWVLFDTGITVSELCALRLGDMNRQTRHPASEGKRKQGAPDSTGVKEPWAPALAKIGAICFNLSMAQYPSQTKFELIR
jgi:integrase